MSWISTSLTHYPSGTVSLGTVLRSVAIASWVENRIRPETKAGYYLATLDNHLQIDVFCKEHISISRNFVPDESFASKLRDKRHIWVAVRVKATDEATESMVPCDPIKMFGTVELASKLTEGVVSTSTHNQHVQDGDRVVLFE